MPRALRLQYPGAWYHVMNRGASRRPTYLDDTDRLRFLELLAESVDRFGVETHAYCLMGNHFHLLLHTPDPNLDRFMHRVCSLYVRFFNSRHNFDGPLCRDRYKAIPIQDDSYLISVARYIHRNPLDLGVRQLGDYQWSSYPTYLGNGAHLPWLSTSLITSLGGGRAGHRAIVESDLRTEVDAMYAHGKTPEAIGSPEFIARFSIDALQVRRLDPVASYGVDR